MLRLRPFPKRPRGSRATGVEVAEAVEAAEAEEEAAQEHRGSYRFPNR